MDALSQEPELRALMLAGLNGDAVAHEELLRRLTVRLRAYFKSKLWHTSHGPAEAEDLLQETLISIHVHRHTYDPTQLFTPWVQAIARYKLIDHLRRAKMSARHVSVEDAGDSLIAEDRAGVDSRFDLDKLLAPLPVKMRRAIELVKLEGLSINEAAQRTGMSPSAVKVSVHRGLKALSALVAKIGGEP